MFRVAKQTVGIIKKKYILLKHEKLEHEKGCGMEAQQKIGWAELALCERFELNLQGTKELTKGCWWEQSP